MLVLPKEPPIALRAMAESDLPGVLRVERAAAHNPWSESIFRDCLRVRYHCLLAERLALPVGHGIMSIGAGECHILNLCVHPDHQRRGLGRRLLRRMLAVGREAEADTAFLEVRASNLGAIALYRNEGFDEIGLRRDYYPAANPADPRREDALAMARAL